MKNVQDIIPAPGYCLIKPTEPEKQTSAGIYIADTVRMDAPQTGQVLAVGEDELTESGYMRAPWFKVGDSVIFKKWGGNDVKIDNVVYLFVKFDDVLAKEKC